MILKHRCVPAVAALTLALVAGGCGDTEGKDHPYLAKAEALRARGEFEGAETYYRRFLRKYPDSRSGLLAAGAFYSECAGDMEQAIACYRAALATGPSTLVEGLLQAARKADFERKRGMFPEPDGRKNETAAATLLREKNALASGNLALRRMIAEQNRVVRSLSAQLEAAELRADGLVNRLVVAEKRVAELEKERKEAAAARVPAAETSGKEPEKPGDDAGLPPPSGGADEKAPASGMEETGESAVKNGEETGEK